MTPSRVLCRPMPAAPITCELSPRFVIDGFEVNHKSLEMKIDCHRTTSNALHNSFLKTWKGKATYSGLNLYAVWYTGDNESVCVKLQHLVTNTDRSKL